MPSSTDIIEALIFASHAPISLEKLAKITELTPEGVAAELEALCEEKRSLGALQLTEVAGGWQFVTKAEFAPFVRRLRDDKKARLSRAAFEVLAIVAYRQPVTRAEIDALRGVESSAPLQFLLERKLLFPAERKDVAGRPWLYKTTPQFLDQFGLKSLEDLPELDEFTALEGVGAHPQTMNLFERGEVKDHSGDA
jgi:segregation and condensation protein B